MKRFVEINSRLTNSKRNKKRILSCIQECVFYPCSDCSRFIDIGCDLFNEYNKLEFKIKGFESMIINLRLKQKAKMYQPNHDDELDGWLINV